jgi:uncharacterized protein YlxW (UPF0749 family)
VQHEGAVSFVSANCVCVCAGLLAQEVREREVASTALVSSSQQEASKLTSQVATLSQKAAEAETVAASLKEQLQKVCAAQRH